MVLKATLQAKGLTLTALEERQIRHHLEALERRLVHRPDPIAKLVLAWHPQQRLVQADLRVRLSPLGQHLVSHQSAETGAHAVRLAVEDVERQLERQLASQRGEPSFGVPSRRSVRRRRRSSSPGPGS